MRRAYKDFEDAAAVFKFTSSAKCKAFPQVPEKSKAHKEWCETTRRTSRHLEVALQREREGHEKREAARAAMLEQERLAEAQRNAAEEER